MVRSRIRHRRSRYHRRKRLYLSSVALSQRPGRFRFLLIYPMVVVALCMALKQPGLALPWEVPANLQPAALGSAIISTITARVSAAPISPDSPMAMAIGHSFTVAQATPIPITQSGSQVLFNNRTVSVPWSQRQDQIGITDSGLVQLVGVDLLSTSDATQQPIEWFSDQQSNPIALSTWHTDQYRYLDLSALATQFGWQVQVNGNTLNVSTPTASITQIRQGRQSWGDRLVVDLDQPAPWQVTEQAGEATITVDAAIDPARLRGLQPRAGNRLTSLKVESSGNRTIIRVGIPSGIRPQIWTIPDPNRLLIDIRSDSLAERDILWAPGLRWQQRYVSLGSARFPVVSLELDPRQSGVRLQSIASNSTTVVGTAPLSTMAQQAKVAAAINGGFFNRNNQLPLGAMRRENRWVSGPILNRGAIAWSDTGETIVGRLSLRETLSTPEGKQFSVVYTNSGYVGNGIYRHTPDWGTSYTSILDNEVLVTVRNQQVTDQTRASKAGQTIPIPADGYVLVVRGDDSFQAMPVGTALSLSAATQPLDFDPYPNIVGAGPLLVQNRQIVLNAQSEQFSDAFNQQSAARSVIASTADGKLMLMAIHNRVGGAGPTLTELARLMQQMGMVNALNLDGGSSTSLYLGGQLIDRPASTAARVNNGIGIYFTPDR